jgi:hypothetical protein
VDVTTNLFLVLVKLEITDDVSGPSGFITISSPTGADIVGPHAATSQPQLVTFNFRIDS